MSTIILEPSLLKWARKRAGLSHARLAQKVLGEASKADRVQEWEQTGEVTFSRAEKIAEKTYTPFGFLFLDRPPKEELPISDFRTIDNSSMRKPSPELLDVIYRCQQRQAWYREYLISTKSEPFSFRLSNTEYPIKSAKDMRAAFGIGPMLSKSADTWYANLLLHIEAIETAGVLVMRSGTVDNNAHRPLSTEEFRGFALSDKYAPLIFINSTDPLAAQLFTLIHELTHVCIGESAVSNPRQTYASTNAAESYCNEVAAEVLVPLAEFVERWREAADEVKEIRRLSKTYKVSTLVIARRARDAGFINPGQFREFYKSEVAMYKSRLELRRATEHGGDFHSVLSARAGHRFASAIVASALGGGTTYKDAFRLLGIKSIVALRRFAETKYGHNPE